MWFLSLLLGILLALPALGQAATVVDYSQAKLSWTEAASPGGPPTSFTVKCGTTPGGPYALTKSYPVVGTMTAAGGAVSISDLITTSGTYVCVVSASNAIGESANSTELPFQAGLAPPAPAGLGLK
jgi:hypothetical protein